MPKNKIKVSMIGVGKLGQPCAEVMAEHYDVVGYDIAQRNPENFEMVANIEDAVIGRDLIFIAIQTPHDPKYDGSTPSSNLENKDFDYNYVKKNLIEINKYASKDQLVILISTTLPGTVREQLAPLIPNARFIYNPYLIAMGSVKWDMVNPEMVIIGTEDGDETTDAKLLKEFYEPMMDNKTRYEIGTWDEAECIKIFYNTFISAKLSIVNMIQDVSEKLGNIDVDIVATALAQSRYRISSPAYMKPGMGDGGPCHPRDNIALRYMAEKLDLGYDLFDAIMTSREVQAKNLAKKLVSFNNPVVILGKAYKKGVPYVDGSYSLLVGYFVEELGQEVHYYDPNTGDTKLPKFEGPITYLLASTEGWIHTFNYITDSVAIDPWRFDYTYAPTNIRIIPYGNTRQV